MKKNILVTGGAGFIGSNVVRHHLAKGNNVWTVDNLQTGRKSNIDSLLSDPSFQFNHADLRTWPKLQQAVDWADRIYHMAADVGQRFVIANPIGTLTNNIRSYEVVLEALSKSSSKPRLILASTSGLYAHSEADANGRFKEDAVTSFPSGEFIQQAYPIGKLVNEVMTLAYVHEKGLHCTIARIFNSIGLNQSPAYGFVVPTFIKQALANLPLTVFGDGLQRRSFINVRDTAAAMELLIENDKSKGEIVNVGYETDCSIIDLAKTIIKRTGSKSEIVYVPYQEAYGMDFFDVRERRPNLEKLKRLTGFHSTRTLEQTIDELTEVATSKKS